MNRTLLIDNIDDVTLHKLEAAARARGVEMIAYARSVLQQNVGTSTAVHHELDSLAGTWSDHDAKEFDAATSAMRSIDPEQWW